MCPYHHVCKEKVPAAVCRNIHFQEEVMNERPHPQYDKCHWNEDKLVVNAPRKLLEIVPLLFLRKHTRIRIRRKGCISPSQILGVISCSSYITTLIYLNKINQASRCVLDTIQSFIQPEQCKFSVNIIEVPLFCTRSNYCSLYKHIRRSLGSCDRSMKALSALCQYSSTQNLLC